MITQFQNLWCVTLSQTENWDKSFSDIFLTNFALTFHTEVSVKSKFDFEMLSKNPKLFSKYFSKSKDSKNFSSISFINLLSGFLT